MNDVTPVKNTPKKKADLGAIAFAKVNKLEKRVNELELAFITGQYIKDVVKSLPSKT